MEQLSSLRLYWLDRAEQTASAIKQEPAAASIQRRLTTSEVGDLGARYLAGASVRQLAAEFRIHRTTVLDHLTRNNIPRRAHIRKLNELGVMRLAELYTAGSSMDDLEQVFSTNATTLRKELRQAGVPLRRPGRPKARD